MSHGKCKNCSKTVYLNEGATIGPPKSEIAVHFACFKCDQAGCSWKLTLGTYIWADGKVYCKAHNPISGASFAGHVANAQDINSRPIQQALNAPKADLVNEQVRTGARK